MKPETKKRIRNYLYSGKANLHIAILCGISALSSIIVGHWHIACLNGALGLVNLLIADQRMKEHSNERPGL